MTRAIFRRRIIAVLLTTLATAGAIAAYATATAAAQGRTIEGNFCLGQHLFCMSAGLDGQTPVEGYGVDGNGGTCATPQTPPNPDVGPEHCVPSGAGLLTLRPGTYWIAVNDDQAKHNFALRSCPGSTSPCSDTNPDRTNDGQAITGLAETYDKPVTIKVNLKHGWYRLFCQSDNPVDHEAAGMYIDIEVGGVGQVG
jgi:hypothetical protein